MANPEHLEVIKKGTATVHDWLKLHPGVRLDLEHADLQGVSLSKVYLEDASFVAANLREADLTGSRLRSVNLYGANLTKATLSKANLFQTNLWEANLYRANLEETVVWECDLTLTKLSEANLAGANLTLSSLYKNEMDRTNLSGASCNITNFANIDLSSVIGLETVHHMGPSTIGVDTLFKSGGKIPENFLRGCGVPDDFITFIPSHFGIQQAIQFYSCFISYSTKDEEFVRRLYSRMRDEKLRVWFAPEDVKGGEKLYEQIERAIQIHDRLLIVLSESSLRSKWVMTEISRARKVELRENRRKLFPIRLVDFDALQAWECFDADTREDLASEVRQYFIPDFSNWKDHDAFERAFERLLRDLRAEEKKPTAVDTPPLP
jgi:hypothetical protein